MTLHLEISPRKGVRRPVRKAWLIAAAVCMVVLGGLATVVAILAHRTEPYVRERIVAALQEHFRARVELDTFHLALGNSLHGEWGVWAVGRGLRVWPPEGEREVSVPIANMPAAAKPSAGKTPETGRSKASQQSSDAAAQQLASSSGPRGPLIQLNEFRFHVPLRFQPGGPLHIALVQLVGLKIDLPPRSHAPKLAAEASPGAKGSAPLASVAIDRIDCSKVLLTLETDKPGKLPQIYQISRAILSGYSTNHPMHFDADLTIPRPQGAVHSSGSFGPWVVADPGESGVDGDYKLAHGDLGVFKGIGGMLDSTGHYNGTLRDMTVVGQTWTPDFRLTHFGNTVPLKTSFHARVDGTNGDTRLDSVDAVLGRSHFTTQGAILRVAPQGAHPGGHDIALNVLVDHTPMEDFLRLTSRSATPLLTGTVVVKAAMHIPPGAVPVHERIRLAGHFSLEGARFSSAKIQNRIEQLSLRGQGHPEAAKSTPQVAISSRMEGDFHLEAGILTLPSLDYSVPGAEIQLRGKYGLEGGTLDFDGTAKMDATVSQMVGGWKGLLLKPADRFFRKNGAGTYIPIHVKGTREQPVFGVDVAGKELDLSGRGKGNQ